MFLLLLLVKLWVSLLLLLLLLISQFLYCQRPELHLQAQWPWAFQNYLLLVSLLLLLCE